MYRTSTHEHQHNDKGFDKSAAIGVPKCNVLDITMKPSKSWKEVNQVSQGSNVASIQLAFQNNQKFLGTTSSNSNSKEIKRNLNHGSPCTFRDKINQLNSNKFLKECNHCEFYKCYKFYSVTIYRIFSRIIFQIYRKC